MKPNVLRACKFVSKSLLWSLLLYFVCMLAINWDDLQRAGKQTSEALVVCQTPGCDQAEANVSVSTGKNIFITSGRLLRQLMSGLVSTSK